MVDFPKGKGLFLTLFFPFSFSRYEFGSGIFVGWAGSALTLLGGGLLSCSCPGKSGPRAQYPKSKAASSNREYV